MYSFSDVYAAANPHFPDPDNDKIGEAREQFVAFLRDLGVSPEYFKPPQGCAPNQ